MLWKKFQKKTIWVSKNAEFDTDFEPVEKFGKKLLRKKVSLKNGFF